ncbi:hypothetical protein EV421DRAFT_1926401 [Armillaria borealis]|uniref:Uncharacterized protein n=1 Tax=Armillaria borealis TaxID=47425 RepID=A0AA39JRJ5_9AGAR|nr:hypothetical protein EV421DRAFT_1926401 [Armillaria borealis]
MPIEAQPVSLAALFSKSQMARRPTPKPAPTNQSAPSASEPPPISTTNTDMATIAPSPVAGLLSHGFNPNTFIRELPRPGPTTFIGSNTTRRKQASIMRNTWRHGEAPTCHILIYSFLSPYHRKKAEKNQDPDVQMGYPLPQSDIYSLEHPEVVPFREHMQKLDLCITYHADSNDTYKTIHEKLLAHNAQSGKPQIPGLKTTDLENLTFDNMGWCFLQLIKSGDEGFLLAFNTHHTEQKSNVHYLICYASLEAKFLYGNKKKMIATPGQFTLVIAPTCGSICHDLSNRNLYVGDYGINSIPDAARHGLHTSQSVREFHCCPAFIDRNPVHEVDEHGPSNLPFKQACSSIEVTLSPSQHPYWPLSPIRRPNDTLPPLPLPPPYYAGVVWPEPQSAQNARAGQFHTFFTQLVDPIDTFGDDALILKGPDVNALTDAVITLSLYYAEHGWNSLNQGFVRYMNDPLGPEFSSPGITCDNWNEPARFGWMKIVLDGTGSHGDGINKMVFREALRKALADTDCYVSMPNNSSYFTANFPMTGCTKTEIMQWRAQGLLLAACTVTFRMPSLPLSPFLFLTLILESTHLPGVLDALSGPVIKALDPASSDIRATKELGKGSEALEITPDLEKSILQNRLVLRLILLSHPLAEQSEAFNAMQQGFAFNFGHASYMRGLLSLFKLRYPTVHWDPNELLEYLDGIYDRKIHLTEDLMKVIDIQYGEVATDPFCSQRLDLGFGKDHNGDDLPLYIGIKQALEQSLRTYFQQDLTRCGERFLVMATSLPYMPCVGSEVKINLQRPGYTDMLSQTFRSNTCFSLVKIKLNMNLCWLLAGQSTDIFPNFTACLDFWLFDDMHIVTLV